MQKSWLTNHVIFKILVGFAALAMFAGASSAQAEMRIGVVNMAQVMKQAPQAEALKRKLDDEFSGRRESIKAQMDKFKQDAEKFQRDSAIMSDADKVTEQRELRSRELRLKEEMAAFQEDGTLRERELTRQLFKDVKGIIDRFAADNGFDLIVTDMGVAYFKEQYDVTTQLLERLRSEYRG